MPRNRNCIDRTQYNVPEYPFVGHDQMHEVATNSGAIYINNFTWRGYFTVHSCLVEAQIWHDINQDGGSSQLIFDTEDRKWHYENLNTMRQPPCTCEKCNAIAEVKL